jgi:hypothetical protein
MFTEQHGELPAFGGNAAQVRRHGVLKSSSSPYNPVLTNLTIIICQYLPGHSEGICTAKYCTFILIFHPNRTFVSNWSITKFPMFLFSPVLYRLFTNEMMRV